MAERLPGRKAWLMEQHSCAVQQWVQWLPSQPRLPERLEARL